MSDASGGYRDLVSVRDSRSFIDERETQEDP